jgi:hypothetical protein
MGRYETKKEGTPWNPAVTVIYPVEVDGCRDLWRSLKDRTGVCISNMKKEVMHHDRAF